MKKILGILLLVVICHLNKTADLSERLITHYPFNGNANDESEIMKEENKVFKISTLYF